MNLSDYQKTKNDFDLIVNELLDCDVDNSSVILARFKNILDEKLISHILKPIKETEFDYKKQDFIRHEFSVCKINSPVDKKKDLKARYDYLADIVNDNIPTIRLCMDFYRKWDKSTHTKFMRQVFGPLYNFIFNELSSKIEELKRKEKSGDKYIMVNNGVYQEIKGNVDGNAIASGRDTNYTHTVSNGDIENIKDIIISIKNLMEKENLKDEVRESIEDDITLIEEQLDEKQPKLTRVKKAIGSITNTMSLGMIKGIELINNMDSFKSAVKSFFVL